MILARRLALALSATVAGVAAACGSSDVQNRDFGQPPDASAFDPGKTPGNGTYGSGGNTGGTTLDGGPGFVCPDDFKMCPHDFTYPDTDAGVTSVELRGDFGGPGTWVTGVPMTRSGGQWVATADVPYNKPVKYKFFVNGSTWLADPAQGDDGSADHNNVFAGTTCAAPKCEESGTPPPGVYDWRDAVIYYVFVDRFNEGGVANCSVSDGSGPLPAAANYQGGDWPGVTAKINDGYFTSLGVNTLWVTVPQANTNQYGQGVSPDTHDYSGYHGYWPKFDSADPTQLSAESCFGTLDQLKELVTAAHTKNLKVLFDYAMVHTHITSQVYLNHKNDWFWPNDNGRPNGQGVDGNCICGSDCSWDNLPDRERCWFADYLPHWNYTNADARNYSVTTAIEWAKQTGIDGFRLDAIKNIDISWLTSFRAAVTAQITQAQTPPQRFYLVGETFDFGNRDDIKGYVDPTTKLDGQFDFPLRANVVSSVIMRQGSMSSLASFMDSNDFYYGDTAVMSTFLGNHDLPRMIHLAADNRIFGDDQGSDGKGLAWSNQPTIPTERSAFERLANGFAVLFTNRGAPLVYYGDEQGMPGAGNPDNRRKMTFTGLDANQSWLKDRVSSLLAIRGAHPALRRGIRTTLSADNDTWVYQRETVGDTVYVAINRSDSDKTVTSLPAGALTELVAGGSPTGPNDVIPARQTRIYVTK